MGEEGAPTLYTTDDTGNYVEYQPPAPPAFQDTLPEDLRGNEHLKEVENPETLARYYVDLKANYLAPPETADGYEYEIPEGFMATDEELARFKNVAFENGLNQKQYQKLMELNVTSQKEAFEKLNQTIEAKREESITALKTEWGADYEKKLESAKSVLNNEKVADENFKKFLEDTRFGDNPQVIRFFAKMSELISEDTFNKPGTGDKAPEPPRTEDGRPMLRFPSMEK
jgi:hypothetical protein